MIRIHCLQHVPFETPGNIEVWANQNGHFFSFTHLYYDEQLPGMDDFEALVILGGPMSIHDENEFPWLKKEKEFIKTAIDQNKRILGICLGSQLIAEVLGARVYNNKEKEIGFMPVTFTEAAFKSGLLQGFDQQEMVFHWHGETFGLPKGAIHLAYTDICKNQAFWIGKNILALQFHLEVTPEIVKTMTSQGGHELKAAAAYVHSAEKILGEINYIERNRNTLFGLLNRFF